MDDDAVLILVALLLYVFFRSHGGKGLGIKFQYAPASTAKGRRDRISTWCVLAFASAAITYVIVDQGRRGIFGVIVPLVAGAIVFLIPYLKSKSRK